MGKIKKIFFRIFRKNKKGAVLVNNKINNILKSHGLQTCEEKWIKNNLKEDNRKKIYKIFRD
ncbi:MAG: hypothetical protein KKF48_03635 [Nanoarchaeota archaeon]|nr:hypothetical protein [Nanoarchaeota archaeon]MBU1028111.1 hypothetical protein [Nanoarchaeota archaeon]